jgi:predicted acylesterase/phospholipase RssA
VVLPVSGQALTSQLGIMLALSGKGYRPSLSLGASGGAIVATQGINNNWQQSTWFSQLYNICDFELLRKYPLGYLQALLEPSIFLRGHGLYNYLEIITSGDLDAFRNNELIINAYNTTTGKTELFSTARRSCSILRDKMGPMELLGVAYNVQYLGDLEDCDYRDALRKTLLATSSVPIVFDPVCIGSSRYVDGGVSFSSPLTAVSCLEPFTDILYINPNNIDEAVPVKYGALFDNAVSFTSQITRSNALQDRYSYLSTLCCGRFQNLSVLNGSYCESDCNCFKMDLQRTLGRPRMVELFPTCSNHVSMIDLQSRSQYLQQIQQASQSFGYRIFYVDV